MTRKTKGEQKCSVLLACEQHTQHEFTDTLIKLLPILAKIIGAFCYETGDDLPLEQIISEYEKASINSLKSRLELYNFFRYKTLLFKNLKIYEIPFRAIGIPFEMTQKLRLSVDYKLVETLRNYYMVEEIDRQCQEHKVVLALVGAGHFGMAKLLKEDENIEVIEILGYTPADEILKYVDELLKKHPGFFAGYKSAPNDYDIEQVEPALIVACLFFANEETQIPGCEEYEFDGLKLNYTDHSVNNTDLLKKYLEFNFPHLLIADSDPEVAALQLDPSVDQTTRQMKGSSFEYSPAESHTAELQTAVHLPETAAVPIVVGGEL